MSYARWEKLVRRAREWFLEISRKKCSSNCDEKFPHCEQIAESWHTSHLMIIDEKTSPNPEDVIDLGDLEFAAGVALASAGVIESRWEGATWGESDLVYPPSIVEAAQWSFPRGRPLRWENLSAWEVTVWVAHAASWRSRCIEVEWERESTSFFFVLCLSLRRE